MSLYLFETGPIYDSDVELALALVSSSFPEIVVERLYAAHSSTGAVVWVCRAPNVAHMQRWAEAGRLHLSHLRQVDISNPRTDGHPATGHRGSSCSLTIGPGIHPAVATTERKEELQ